MDPAAFFNSVPGFFSLSGVDKVLAVGWYLHVHGKKETYTTDDLRTCFRKGHVEPPDLSVYLPRLRAKKPPQVLRNNSGYRLDGATRRKLDAKYGASPTKTAISALLASLPDKIPNLAERDFLRETLLCYQLGAFRATTVMAWNLAFDHFCNWLMEDPKRLMAFNTAIKTKFPKKPIIVVRADFEEFKESELIEIARTGKLITKNIATVLDEKLRRRNMAAHPSTLIIEQPQADDTISDLVNNVVLALE